MDLKSPSHEFTPRNPKINLSKHDFSGMANTDSTPATTKNVSKKLSSSFSGSKAETPKKEIVIPEELKDGKKKKIIKRKKANKGGTQHNILTNRSLVSKPKLEEKKSKKKEEKKKEVKFRNCPLDNSLVNSAFKELEHASKIKSEFRPMDPKNTVGKFFSSFVVKSKLRKACSSFLMTMPELDKQL